MNDQTTVDFLEEAPGEKSMMRLMANRSWWAGLGFCVVGVALYCWEDLRPAGTAALTTGAGFMTGAYGGKLWQKSMEVKAP